MSLKPTSLLEWVLLGYGGVVVVLCLIVTPLVIGLGDDNGRGSPIKGLRLSGGSYLFRSGVTKRGSRAWKKRARNTRTQAKAKATATAKRGTDPCKVAILRMISCTKDAKIRRQLSARKDRFAAECRRSSKDVRRASRCVKQTNCAGFGTCLSGK
jgi:hypothetical protein